jgi:release factor glutamine methyltransferase
MAMAEIRRTPADVLRAGSDYLARHGVESPRETAEALLMNVLSTDRAGLYAGRESLDQPAARSFARALCARCRGTPVQYLTGEQQFRGLRMIVRPGVLVPRPETEVLVDVALEVVPNDRPAVVIDVGTGTGAVALAIKHERRVARVLATDISGEAAALAEENAARLSLEIEVFMGDLIEAVPVGLRGAVDVVVSNPPYLTEEEYGSLPPEVRAEPYEALVGGTELHERLAAEAPPWLRPGGWLIVEIGESQAPAVIDAFSEAGFTGVEVLPDLAGRHRVVRGRLA